MILACSERLYQGPFRTFDHVVSDAETLQQVRYRIIVLSKEEALPSHDSVRM